MSQVMLKSPRGEAIEPLVVSAPIPDLEDVLKEVIMHLPFHALLP